MRILYILLLTLSTFTALGQWRSVNTNGLNHTLKIQFINDSIGFANDSLKLYKSIDQGENWLLLSNAPGPSPSSIINDFHCVDSLTIYAITDNSYLYKSDNGGTTWQLNRFIGIGGLSKISFASHRKGYFIGATNLGTSYFGVTNDSAATWQLDTIQGYYYANSIDVVNEDTVYCSFSGIVLFGSVLYTYDGGQTWAGNNLSASIRFINDIHFVSPNTGYIVGWRGINYEMAKTTNAGSSWNAINVSGSSNDELKAVYFTSVDTGFVGGENGRFLYTTDAGSTWTSLNQNFDIEEIQFINSKVGFIAGSSSGFLKNDSLLITGMESIDITSKWPFKLSPIPAKNEITIQGNDDLIGKQFFIYKLNGQVQTEGTLNSTLHQVDVSQLSKGIYFLIIPENNIREKLIIY